MDKDVVQWNITQPCEMNEIMPFMAACMDPEIITLSEVRQRKTTIILYHLYMESKK